MHTLEPEDCGHQRSKYEKIYITERKELGKHRMIKLLSPDARLDSKDEVIDGDEGIMDIVRIYKMNRIVKVCVNSNTDPEGQSISENAPIWLIFRQHIEEA